MDTKEIQKRIIENKISKGFSTDNIEQEFLLLQGEVAESYAEVLKNDKEALADELADVAIYLFGIAELSGIDLGKAIERKVSINEKRVYIKMENGVFRKITSIYDGEVKRGKVLGMLHADAAGKISEEKILEIIKLYDEDIFEINVDVSGTFEPDISVLVYKTKDGKYDFDVFTEEELRQQVKLQK